MGKVYFNARFDDVMLIVKREMASVLRGPLPVTIWGYNRFIYPVFHSRNIFIGISSPGKSDCEYIDLSCMCNGLFCSAR